MGGKRVRWGESVTAFVGKVEFVFLRHDACGNLGPQSKVPSSRPRGQDNYGQGIRQIGGERVCSGFRWAGKGGSRSRAPDALRGSLWLGLWGALICSAVGISVAS